MTDTESQIQEAQSSNQDESPPKSLPRYTYHIQTEENQNKEKFPIEARGKNTLPIKEHG